MNLQQMFTE